VLAGGSLTVQVPFGFTAGGSTFPPGEYELTMGQVAPGAVLIRGPKSAMVLSQRSVDGVQDAKPALSFRVYGEQRFLSAIKAGRESWTLVRSALENELASSNGQPVIADLLARVARAN
jgi:hypothetical protein